MNRENYRHVLHQRIVSIRGTQQHRHKRRLPVVAMKHVRGPDVLGHLNRGSAKLRIPFSVVRILSAASAVQSIAVEIRGIIHEVIPHPIQHRARGNTTATSWPCATSAFGSASTTSARPPVLENGSPSDATNKILTALSHKPHPQLRTYFTLHVAKFLDGDFQNPG